MHSPTNGKYYFYLENVNAMAKQELGNGGKWIVMRTQRILSLKKNGYMARFNRDELIEMVAAVIDADTDRRVFVWD